MKFKANGLKWTTDEKIGCFEMGENLNIIYVRPSVIQLVELKAIIEIDENGFYDELWNSVCWTNSFNNIDAVVYEFESGRVEICDHFDKEILDLLIYRE